MGKHTETKKKEKNIGKEEKKKVDAKQVNEGMEELEKEIANKKHLPKEEENKINKKVFENIMIADVVMAFLYFISLGSLNIETLIFVADLKVFSIGLILFTIILFEISYKKENGNLAIHGIESLALSIFILFSIYLYLMDMKDFHMYVAIAAYAFAIYYVGKSIILYRKMKKKYFASLSDIDEIVKKR